MEIKKLSNTRTQNFGAVIVLEPGGDNSWNDLIDMLSPESSYRLDGFIDLGKGKLLVSTGDERKVLGDLSDDLYKACKQKKLIESQQIGFTLAQRVIEFGRKARETIIVTTLDNIKNILGFEELVKKY